MNNRQGAQTPIPLDPLFTPPIGAEDSFHVDTTKVIIVPSQGQGIGIQGISGMPVIDMGAENPYVLQTPDAIYIYDQKLRRAPGGQQVVDVTLDVEEIVGAIEYEVQIAKV